MIIGTESRMCSQLISHVSLSQSEDAITMALIQSGSNVYSSPPEHLGNLPMLLSRLGGRCVYRHRVRHRPHSLCQVDILITNRRGRSTNTVTNCITNGPDGSARGGWKIRPVATSEPSPTKQVCAEDKTSAQTSHTRAHTIR